MPRGEPLDQQRQRGLVAQAVGHGEDPLGRGHGQLRVAAGVQQGHHPLAVHRCPPTSPPSTNGASRSATYWPSRWWVSPKFTPASAHAHEHLALARLRVAARSDTDSTSGPPNSLDQHGLHTPAATFGRVRRLAVAHRARDLAAWAPRPPSAAKVSTRRLAACACPGGSTSSPASNGDALVAERTTGRIIRIARPGGRKRVVMRIPGRGHRRRRGRPARPGRLPQLLARQARSTPTSPAARDNRIVRFRLGGPVNAGAHRDRQREAIHNGGRLEFGRDGKLYASVGDAGDQLARAETAARSTARSCGMNPNGSAPLRQPVPGARASSPSATATPRASPSTAPAGCGRRSSARTPSTR